MKDNSENEIFSFGDQNVNAQENDFSYSDITGLNDIDDENIISEEEKIEEPKYETFSGDKFDPFAFEPSIQEKTDGDILEDFSENANMFDTETEKEEELQQDVQEDTVSTENIFEGTPVSETVEEPQQDVQENTVPTENIFEGTPVSETVEEPQQDVQENTVPTENIFEETPVSETVEEPQQDVQEDTVPTENIFEGTPVSETVEEPQQDVQEDPVPTENIFEETPVEEKNIVVAEEENLDTKDPEMQSFNFNSNIDDLKEDEGTEKIEISDTPIEELNKLTQYKEEKLDKTDIVSLFDRLSLNVQDASDIFKRNNDMKKKIDSRFEELKKLQDEIEKSKKSQIEEINKYKDEVLGKLNEKKTEIENRLNILRELQTKVEQEREEFDNYKKEQEDEITRVQKEIQESYDERREELEHIEDVLRKQKDDLDDKRSKLSLDIIQYESDKNALANNILKFNEVVDSFTKGMNSLEEE